MAPFILTNKVKTSESKPRSVHLDLILPLHIHMPPTATQLPGASIRECLSKKAINPTVMEDAFSAPVAVYNASFPLVLLEEEVMAACVVELAGMDDATLLEADCTAMVVVLAENCDCVVVAVDAAEVVVTLF